MPTATKQRARREVTRELEGNEQTRRDPGSHEGRRAGSASPSTSTRARRKYDDPIEIEIQATWKAYKAKPRSELRERLIVHYMAGHVRRIAERMRASLPGHIDADDLMQQGYLGLVESIERFEMERGIRFETFSSRRISGAMQDYLRAQDHLPRLVRTRSRRVNASIEAFRVQWGRTPDPRELQEEMRLDDEAFSQAYKERRAPSVMTFSAVGGGPDGNEDGGAMMNTPDLRSESPLRQLQRKDLQRWVTQGMDRRDRLIILLYYYEEMTMREIGLALGCSESRISQRLDSILRRLRSRLCPGSDEVQFETA